MKLEFIKPDKLDPATKLTGLDYVDVPGNSSVEYKLNFYAFKETQYQLKVCPRRLAEIGHIWRFYVEYEI